MSRVVIVARTRMHGNDVCIGGHDLESHFRGVRLLDRRGNHFTSESPFAVGEVWNLRYRPKSGHAPHLEDVAVQEQQRIGTVPNLKELILNHVQPWTGGSEALFDGMLSATRGGTGYVAARGPLPRCSTGFWLPDHDLVREQTEGRRPRFRWEGRSAIRWFGWVGVQAPPDRLEAGSLVRVSLSRIFGSETAPDGYYLQLSGVISG